MFFILASLKTDIGNRTAAITGQPHLATQLDWKLRISKEKYYRKTPFKTGILWTQCISTLFAVCVWSFDNWDACFCFSNTQKKNILSSFTPFGLILMCVTRWWVGVILRSPPFLSSFFPVFCCSWLFYLLIFIVINSCIQKKNVDS